MNTRFLETLVWLSRLGSFRETAQHMHATQAAISQRIATLEAELGAILVDREASNFKLTPAGTRVLRHAERLLSLERELRATARPDAPPAGRVRIGVIESVVHSWLAPLVDALACRYPGLEPDFTVDTARNLREQFRHHRLDVLIQNDPVEAAAGSDDLQVALLCRFPIQWIGRPGLVPRRRLTTDDLIKIPLLTFSRTSSPHAHVRALFTGSELEPRISSFPSVAAILQLLMQGFGLAAIPPVFVRQELRDGVLLKFAGPSLPPLTISLVYPRIAAPAVLAVAAATRDAVREYCAMTGGLWAVSLLSGANSQPPTPPRGHGDAAAATKPSPARTPGAKRRSRRAV